MMSKDLRTIITENQHIHPHCLSMPIGSQEHAVLFSSSLFSIKKGDVYQVFCPAQCIGFI